MNPDTHKNGHCSALQWMAIAPLIALTSSLVSGVAAGVLMVMVLVILSLVFSVLRVLVPYQFRLPVIILVTATVISMIGMGMKYYFFELHAAMGIYFPLLGVNSLILALSEDYFFRNSIRSSLYRALTTGVVFFLLFTILGLFREVAGYGTLLRDSEMMEAAAWTLAPFRIFEGFNGISILHGAPGALLVCGLLAAMINYFSDTDRDISAASP